MSILYYIKIKASKNCRIPDMVSSNHMLKSKIFKIYKIVLFIKAHSLVNNTYLKFKLLGFFPTVFSFIARFFNSNNPCAVKMPDLPSILNGIHAGSLANTCQTCILCSYKQHFVWEDVGRWGIILANLLRVGLQAIGYIYESFCITSDRIQTLDLDKEYKTMHSKTYRNWNYIYYNVWNLFKVLIEYKL